MIHIAADLHTHTIASTHAFSTITEMAHEAARLGMYAFAVTDHGPKMPDSPHIWHFTSLRRLPDQLEGVWVLKGIEANVCTLEGKMDVSDDELRDMGLDWVIASIHPPTLVPSLSVEQATHLWLQVAKNPYVDMIGHCETPRYTFDFDAVVREFAREGKVVELNANSSAVRPGGEENMKKLLAACKKHGAYIALNSDAHFSAALGRVESVIPLVEEMEYPKELIVNAAQKNLLRFLQQKKKPIAQHMR